MSAKCPVLGPQRTQQITERAFQISFHPEWQMDNSFLMGQSWHILTSWYTGEGQEKGVWRCFIDRLNQSLDLSVVQARYELYRGLQITIPVLLPLDYTAYCHYHCCYCLGLTPVFYKKVVITPFLELGIIWLVVFVTEIFQSLMKMLCILKISHFWLTKHAGRWNAKIPTALNTSWKLFWWYIQ